MLSCDSDHIFIDIAVIAALLLPASVTRPAQSVTFYGHSLRRLLIQQKAPNLPRFSVIFRELPITIVHFVTKEPHTILNPRNWLDVVAVGLRRACLALAL